MADTRKPKSKSGPAGRNQPGRSTGAAAKTRQREGRGAPAGGKGRPADRGKLAKGAAARRLEAKKRRQRTLVWTTVAVVAVAALVGLIVFQGRDGSPSSAVRPVSPAALEAGRQAAGSDGVKTFAEAGRTHIGPGEQADDWNSNPPTSGDHLATTVSAGVYDNEQDQRALVHNLEHGYVVILYKGLPEDQQDQLRKFVDERGDAKLVLAPSSGLETNGVALTAWRTLETMDRVNLDVVQAFVNDYMVPLGDKSSAPEPFAP